MTDPLSLAADRLAEIQARGGHTRDHLGLLLEEYGCLGFSEEEAEDVIAAVDRDLANRGAETYGAETARAKLARALDKQREEGTDG